MGWWAWGGVGVALLALLLWTAWTSTRLRRLGRRVQLAWSALDVLLQRRSAVVGQAVARHRDLLGPLVAHRLERAVAGALSPPGGDREAAENALARALHQDAGTLSRLPDALTAELADTAARVGLARSFYNDAVRDTRALRRSRLTRVLRLHARRPVPRYFDITESDGAHAGPRRPGAEGADRAVG